MNAYTQVTSACPVSLRFSSDQRIGTCMQFVMQDPRNLLAVTYSPMVRDYKKVVTKYKDQPKKIVLEKQRVSLELAGIWDVEMALIRSRMDFIRMAATEANVTMDRIVVMLDHEDAVMNDVTRPAIKYKLDQIYDLIKFHGCQVFHYNIGSIRQDFRDGSGWTAWDAVPADCKTDFASMSLYYLTELMHMREAMRRTMANVEGPVVPFISIGWQWTRKYSRGKNPRIATQNFSEHFTSILADDLNKKWKSNVPKVYFNNTRVPMIWTWPGVGNSPTFWKHFYAYHRGAVHGSTAGKTTLGASRPLPTEESG